MRTKTEHTIYLDTPVGEYDLGVKKVQITVQKRDGGDFAFLVATDQHQEIEFALDIEEFNGLLEFFRALSEGAS